MTSTTTTDRTTQRGGPAPPGRRAPLRLGFVPLIDAAPLVAAAELGYLADEGLAVSLERQIGWGNVRDKLTFGQLDTSHALIGMPTARMPLRTGTYDPPGQRGTHRAVPA